MTNLLLAILGFIFFCLAQIIYYLAHYGLLPGSLYESIGSQWDATAYTLAVMVSAVCFGYLLYRLWFDYKGRPRKNHLDVFFQTQEDSYDDFYDDLVALYARKDNKLKEDIENSGIDNKPVLVPPLTEEKVECSDKKTENTNKELSELTPPPVIEPIPNVPPAVVDAPEIKHISMVPSIPDVPSIAADVPTALPVKRPEMQPEIPVDAIPGISEPVTAHSNVVEDPTADEQKTQCASEDSSKPNDTPSSEEPTCTQEKDDDKEKMFSVESLKEAMKGEQGPLEMTISVLEKADVPSSVYSLNEDKEGAVCVHKGKNGMFEIYDFTDGRAQNVYIAKNELAACKNLIKRIREKIA